MEKKYSCHSYTRAAKDAEIIIEAQGEDEKKDAVTELGVLIESNFGE